MRQRRLGVDLRLGFSARIAIPPAERPSPESPPIDRASRGQWLSPGMICSSRQSAALTTAARPEAAPQAPRSLAIDPSAKESPNRRTEIPFE